MFTTPIPRSSFLDSRLRVHGRANRCLTHGQPVGDSHLGLGPRPAPRTRTPRAERRRPAAGL